MEARDSDGNVVSEEELNAMNTAPEWWMKMYREAYTLDDLYIFAYNAGYLKGVEEESKDRLSEQQASNENVVTGRREHGKKSGD